MFLKVLEYFFAINGAIICGFSFIFAAFFWAALIQGTIITIKEKVKAKKEQ